MPQPLRPLDDPRSVTLYDHRALPGMAPPPRRQDHTFPRLGEKAAFVAAVRSSVAPARLSYEGGAWHVRPALSLADAPPALTL